MKQVLKFLGLGQGKNALDEVVHVTRIVQAAYSAFLHFKERMAEVTGQPPALPFAGQPQGTDSEGTPVTTGF